MKAIRSTAVLITALSVSFGISGCGGGSTTSNSANAVKVAIQPSLSAMPLFVAKERGFFKDEGLKITLTPFEGGPAAVQALLADSVDVAHAGVVPFLNVVNQKAPVSGIAYTATKDSQDTSNQLFVKRGSGISSLYDLKGKKIGINQQGNFEQFALNTFMLPKHGLDGSAVKYLEIPYSSMENTLAKGQVDAVISDEPFTSRLAANSGFSSIDSSGAYLPIAMPTSVQASKSDWAKSAAAASYTKALTTALQWAVKHPEQTATIVARGTKLPKKTVKVALKNVEYPKSATLEPDSWDKMVDLMVEAGFLPKGTDVSKNLVVVGD